MKFCESSVRFTVMGIQKIHFDQSWSPDAVSQNVGANQCLRSSANFNGDWVLVVAQMRVYGTGYPDKCCVMENIKDK